MKFKRITIDYGELWKDTLKKYNINEELLKCKIFIKSTAFAFVELDYSIKCLFITILSELKLIKITGTTHDDD